MGTKALPHAGIGVKAYSWATSPLRRYVDLVNQWQIIACARHGKTAALAAPFKPKDAELFGIISSFDGAYSAYNGYQAGMERFWTLKYLEQNGITELTAASSRKAPAASWCAPTICRWSPVLGAQNLPRGARVRVKLGEIDEITLDIHGTLIERLDDPTTQRRRRWTREDDDDTVAGPIAIAVDVNDAEGASADNPPVTLPAALRSRPRCDGAGRVHRRACGAADRALRRPEASTACSRTRRWKSSWSTPAQRAPDKAQAIAQASLAGGGDAARAGPPAPCPTRP
jgi:hypothetical protein